MTDKTHPRHVIPGGLSDRTLTQDTRWRRQAACRTVGEVDTFFDTTSTAVTVARYLVAKEICRTCPVVQACLSFVVDNDGRWTGLGIWGGLTPAERLDKTVVARVLELGAKAIPDLYFQLCAHCQDTKIYATAGRTPGSNWFCQKAPCRRAASRGIPKSPVVAA